MILGKRLKGKAIATWLGPTGDAARRAAAGLRRRVSGASRRLDLYFDIADPWSYLAAQAASHLLERYPVELGFTVVTPPASEFAPQPALRAKHAVRDARELAAYWDLDFPGTKEPDPGLVRDVGTALVRERPAAEQLRAALELGAAMWRGDRKALASLLGAWGTEAHGAVAPILNASYAALRKAGHYQGGTIHYEGEWYGGADRVRHLEAALARDHGGEVAGVVAPRPEAERGPLSLGAGPLTCELWFSFRSPYSYLALEQLEAVLAPHGSPLVARPILPLVTRGHAVPTAKQLYIVRDAKREADRLGIPFGALCDPLGAGVANCIAIAHWAEQRGRLVPFARSAMRGIWAEARDLSEYVDLRHVVERAELPWDEARRALGDDAATRWAQQSAADLAVIGLWGVPSLRIGDLVTWGQDRLPLVADRLRRHAAAGEIVREPAEPA
jgi:2-hydroxychromene-2-carboxylate isomerase